MEPNYRAQTSQLYPGAVSIPLELQLVFFESDIPAAPGYRSRKTLLKRDVEKQRRPIRRRARMGRRKTTRLIGRQLLALVVRIRVLGVAHTLEAEGKPLLLGLHTEHAQGDGLAFLDHFARI